MLHTEPFITDEIWGKQRDTGGEAGGRSEWPYRLNWFDVLLGGTAFDGSTRKSRQPQLEGKTPPRRIRQNASRDDPDGKGSKLDLQLRKENWTGAVRKWG